MLLRRLGPHIRRQDWFAVTLDLLVVVIGILLAFQIDRWREQRADQALEVTYIQRLIADVETDLPNIQSAIKYAEERRGFAELLMAAVKDPAAAAAEPARFLVSVQAAGWTNTPDLASYTFEDLRSTGNLGLIRDPAVKQALYDYYGWDQHRRQWMDLALAAEEHWFEVVAGVTDHEQQNWVTDAWGEQELDAEEEQLLWRTPFEPQPILTAVERLRLRHEAVDWLPNLRSTQLLAISENQQRLALAESLLHELKDYLARLAAE